MVLSAYKETVVRDRGRGAHKLTDRVFCQQLEVWGGREHEGVAVFVDGIDVAADQHRRRNEVAAQSFCPEVLTGLCLMTPRDTQVTDPIEMSLPGHHRRDVW